MIYPAGVEEWFIDKLEKSKIKQLVLNDGGKEDLLMLSQFISLKDPSTGYMFPDTNVFDATNRLRTGGVEFKSYADLIGSLTGAGVVKKASLDETETCSECGGVYTIKFVDNLISQQCEKCGIIINKVPKFKWEWQVNDGLYHLFKQIIKMYSTGLPWCIIIHGSRYWFQQKSGVSSGLILSALQRLSKLCAIYRGTVIQVDDEHEAFECMKSFLRGTIETPRRWPIYNLFKKIEHDQIAMHCGITGFDIATARAIYEKGYRPCDIGYDAKRVQLGEITLEEFKHKYGGIRKDDLKTKVEGLGLKKAEMLYYAYAPLELKELDYPTLKEYQLQEGIS